MKRRKQNSDEIRVALSGPDGPWRHGPIGASRNGGRVIEDPEGFLRKKMPELYKWLVEFFGIAYFVRRHILLRDQSDPESDVVCVSFSMWSGQHEFVISATAKGKSTKGRGYLSAGLVNRAPYVGEQHRRGRDLSDGPYAKETWDSIVRDIHIFTMKELKFLPRLVRKVQQPRKARRVISRTRKGRRS